MLRRDGRARPRSIRMDGIRAPLLALAALTSAACSAPAPPPNVVMIVIDTLRADRLGSYGYSRPTSPNIDALARESCLFENAVSQSSWTGPSIASLFTSMYPSQHGMVDFKSSLGDALPTLAGVFRATGYTTLGVSANFTFISPNKGFSRDFDTFEVLSRPPEPGEKAEIYGTNSVAGGEVTERVFSLLAENRADPFFLYVHYMDPHSSYDPPAPFRDRFVADYDGPIDGSTEQLQEIVRGELEIGPADIEHLQSLYDAEVATADAEVGRLLDHLRAIGAYEDSIVVLLSDHGEEFMDHGSLFHMFTLYREQIHVPLILRKPGGLGGGTRVASIIELVDVGPTVLELAGIDDAREISGASHARSMGPPVAAVSAEGDAALSELHGDPLVTSVWRRKRHHAAMTTQGWTLLAGDRRDVLELYESATDEQQQIDRSATERDVRERLDGLLRAHPLTVWDERPDGDLSDEQRSGLRALGYSD
ncbi:MAG: sulfatase [Deltaproteobacteria bacterium]|nr:sulfatase [Deltaproteobacteria bacterium]